MRKNGKTRKWTFKARDVVEGMTSNLNAYVTINENGGRTITYKSWDGSASPITFDRYATDEELITHFGGKYLTEHEIAFNNAQTLHSGESDPLVGGAEAGNRDSKSSGEKGLYEVGIPLMAGTVSTIVTFGAGSGVFGGGFASTYLGSSTIGGGINMSGNILGQVTSETEFDYADPFIALGSAFLKNPFAQTAVDATGSSLFDLKYNGGFDLVTPLDGKDIGVTLCDFGFGLVGGMAGSERLYFSNSTELTVQTLLEYTNNKTNDAIEGN